MKIVPEIMEKIIIVIVILLSCSPLNEVHGLLENVLNDQIGVSLRFLLSSLSQK